MKEPTQRIVKIDCTGGTYDLDLRNVDDIMNELLLSDLSYDSIRTAFSNANVKYARSEKEECFHFVAEAKNVIRKFEKGKFSYDKCGVLPPTEFDYTVLQIREIFSIQQTYLTCLKAKKSNNERRCDKIKSVFEMLYSASDTAHLFNHNIENLFAFLDENYPAAKKKCVSIELRERPQFVLADEFGCFLKSIESEERRGRSYRYIWQRQGEKAEKETIKEFDRFLLWQEKHISKENRQYVILLYDPKKLANTYIEKMDNYINKALGDIRIDGHSGRHPILYVNKASFRLWLALELSKDDEYKLCAICGKPFHVGNQKSIKYCRRHTKSQINYFNQKLAKERNM